MSEYCERSDIENRLTATGLLYVADRDLSGTASETELSKHIDPSIVYAGNLIDGYLATNYDYRTGIGNPWLKDRAIDLAAAKCVEVGGQNLPQAMKDARDYTISLLEKVQGGNMLVPNLAQPSPANTPWPSRTVKILNPKVRW